MNYKCVERGTWVRRVRQQNGALLRFLAGAGACRFPMSFHSQAAPFQASMNVTARCVRLCSRIRSCPCEYHAVTGAWMLVCVLLQVQARQCRVIQRKQVGTHELRRAHSRGDTAAIWRARQQSTQHARYASVSLVLLHSVHAIEVAQRPHRSVSNLVLIGAFTRCMQLQWM